MATEKSGFDDESDEEKFRELSLKQQNQFLNRQNEEIEIQRDKLMDYIRYYFLIIGFSITLFQFKAISEFWAIPAIIPPVFGIIYAAITHRDLGNYTIGFEKGLYDKHIRESGSYIEAIEKLSGNYDNIWQENREHLISYEKSIRRHISIVAISLGVLTGIFVWV